MRKAQNIKKSKPKMNIMIALKTATIKLTSVFITKYDLISIFICSKTIKNDDFSHPVMIRSLFINDLLSKRINTVKKNIIPVFLTIFVIMEAVADIILVKFIFSRNWSSTIFWSILYFCATDWRMTVSFSWYPGAHSIILFILVLIIWDIIYIITPIVRSEASKEKGGIIQSFLKNHAREIIIKERSTETTKGIRIGVPMYKTYTKNHRVISERFIAIREWYFFIYESV